MNEPMLEIIGAKSVFLKHPSENFEFYSYYFKIFLAFTIPD